MSWNEPGGNKKDPWSGRDQQNAPPDLDEVVRALEEKLGRIFGRRSPGQGGSQVPFQLAGLVLLVVLSIWGLTGIYLVAEGSRGVVTRFGAYNETTVPGLHWHIPAPIESVDIVNMDQQRVMEIGYRSGSRQQSSGSVPKEALMLTQDENIIDIRLAVQYQIKDPKAYLFNIADIADSNGTTLREVVESAQRAVIGENTMDFVLTEGRGSVADEIKKEIQETLDQYEAGILITSVSLVDAQPPEQVQSAFEDAIKSREDEQRLKNEAEAYKNEVVPKARGAAARLLAESEAYKQKAISRAEGEASRFARLLTEYEKAPDVTRERMYLDAMQDVLGQTGNVVVDLKGSNNVLYLPVDQLKKRRSNPELGIHETAETAVTTRQEPPTGDTSSIRGTRSPGREGRGQER